MSLSSAFRAVGNDPGIITWRIEVSGAGAHLPLVTQACYGTALLSPVRSI